MGYERRPKQTMRPALGFFYTTLQLPSARRTNDPAARATTGVK
jgi:hypothetical protein